EPADRGKECPVWFHPGPLAFARFNWARLLAEPYDEEQRGNRKDQGERRDPFGKEGTHGRARPERGAYAHENTGFSQQPCLPISRSQQECTLDGLTEIAGDH